MQVEVSRDKAKNSLKIRLSGRFDFSGHKDFRSAYRDEEPGRTFYVDMRDVNYIDSSALGMLLLLKKHADNGNGKVIIQTPQEDVRKVLDIANFDKIFQID